MDKIQSDSGSASHIDPFEKQPPTFFYSSMFYQTIQTYFLLKQND